MRRAVLLSFCLVIGACSGESSTATVPPTAAATLPSSSTTSSTTSSATSSTAGSERTTTTDRTATTAQASTTTAGNQEATTVPTATTAAPSTTTTTGPPQPLADLSLRAETVIVGLRNPVFLAAPRGDDRLFVLEQDGRILVFPPGAASGHVFLDIRNRIASGGERGLLGLAFHPRYVETGRFFVNYTNTSGDTVVAEFATDPANPDRADPATERILLTVAQPASNHNGGMVAFGPDGLLYIGLGDGGGANDRFDQGQRPETLLGTIARVDVDIGDPYGIPAANPFADGVDGAPEVWAWGLRNPWRFSFDGETIFIADVGQDDWEEIDAIPVGVLGVNFGWPITEGFECFQRADCDRTGVTDPIYAYPNRDGACSITGGYVYRGFAIPDLVGAYFFGDFCTGGVTGFRVDGEGVYEIRDWSDDLSTPLLASFGIDGFGELYLVSQSGTISRIAPG
ncbi:MAG TPA: PQQ-dependent sugar dehydrogenase [Acidimicrobiia bacterium]|nr:PQQ-dependent sugar dehydrogenase [Acidimicrobiia bacterium]